MGTLLTVAGEYRGEAAAFSRSQRSWADVSATTAIGVSFQGRTIQDEV